MKKVPNKIILNLLLILLLNGCHTLQHNGFQDKIPKKETKNIIYNNFKNSSKNSKIEKETTEEVTQKLKKNSELENLKKQKKSRQKKINLTSILKLSETDLLKRLVEKPKTKSKNAPKWLAEQRKKRPINSKRNFDKNKSKKRGK